MPKENSQNSWNGKLSQPSIQRLLQSALRHASVRVCVSVCVRLPVSPLSSAVISAAGRAPRGDTHLHVMRLAAVMLMAPDVGSFVAVCSPAARRKLSCPSVCPSIRHAETGADIVTVLHSLESVSEVATQQQVLQLAPCPSFWKIR